MLVCDSFGRYGDAVRVALRRPEQRDSLDDPLAMMAQSAMEEVTERRLRPVQPVVDGQLVLPTSAETSRGASGMIIGAHD